jgi:hypothetical protein
MKTPLMFGKNSHAKLREIKGGEPTSLYSMNGNNMFSPQSGLNRNFAMNNKNTVGRGELGALSPISGGKPTIIPKLNLHK